jgi:hypothetical protein
MSFCTSGSVYLRPMRRLVAYSVAAWLTTPYKHAIGGQLRVSSSPWVLQVERPVEIKISFARAVSEREHTTPHSSSPGETGRVQDETHLTPGGESYEPLSVLGERHDGRGRSTSLAVLDDTGDLSLHDGDTRVGRAKVDTCRRCE